ncbi:MAG: ribonuclease P [Candidatus Altiarchaeota archaeon]
MARHSIKQEKRKQKDIARERIGILFERAEEASKSSMSLANRYLMKARDISMKHNEPISRSLKRMMCKGCYGFLKPGVTSRTRIHSKERRVVVECLSCGKRMYYPIKK